MSSSALKPSAQNQSTTSTTADSQGAEQSSAAGSGADPEHAEWADIEIKYEGYLVREREAAARLAELDEVPLPATLAYHSIQTISWEAREKLTAVQPTSIGQAGRVPGVSPADLQNLVQEVRRLRSSGASTPS